MVEQPGHPPLLRTLFVARRSTVLLGLGAFVAWATSIVVGWAVGSMLTDTFSWGADAMWGNALWTLLGLAGGLLSRRSASGAEFWRGWTCVSFVLFALYSDNLVVAALAALPPFLLLMRPASPQRRLAGSALALFALEVGAAVWTNQLGPYGTAAGLLWALGASGYFAWWALVEEHRGARRLAWALGSLWSVACLAVAVSDAVRFHDVQSWVALGLTSAGTAALLLASANKWQVRATSATSQATSAA